MEYIFFAVLILMICGAIYCTFRQGMRLGKRMGWSKMKCIAYALGLVKD